MDILFGNEITTMVKNREFALPFALLYKWCYYLTMEGCSFESANLATKEYIISQKYQVTLVEESTCWVKFEIQGISQLS